MDEIAKHIRVPLAVDLGFLKWSGHGITLLEYYGMKNLVVRRDVNAPEPRLLIESRPAFKVSVSNTSGTKIKGRGIYAWADNTTAYFVNDDKIYRDSYSNLVGTISTGHQKCHFTQIGAQLMMTDPENSKAYTITTGHVLSQITNVNFPTTLAHGACTLNGRAYVMDTSSNIYGSDLDDGTTWNSLNVIEAEREPDKGRFIGKHFSSIVAIGASTIEFFDDVANPTGSVLQRREDVFYNIGAIDGRSVVESGDVIFFVGSEKKGKIGVYKLENYRLTKVSTYSIDSWLSDLGAANTNKIWLSAFQARGSSFISLSVYSESNGFYMSRPSTTILYDNGSGYWSFCTSYISEDGASTLTTGSDREFSLTSWAGSTGAYGTFARPLGITGYGVIFGIDDSLSGLDTAYNSSSSIFSPVGLACQVITRWVDGGSLNYKYLRGIRLVGDIVSVNSAGTDTYSPVFSVAWSDTVLTDNSTVYPRARNLQLVGSDDSTIVAKLTRGGRFKRRSFNIKCDPSLSLVTLEALELEVALGDN